MINYVISHERSVSINITGPLEKAKHYLELHEHDQNTGLRRGGPCITISRETGAGADRIGERLIEFFRQFEQEFTLFDKNLIDKILEDNDLPHKLSAYFPEDKVPALQSTMNELFGIHPPLMKLLHKATKTILQLADLGNVILVGRAANVITAKLPNCFHVRLVAPHETRVKNMEKYYGMGLKEAMDFIDREDKARRKYVESNYHKDIADPTLYHLVLNVHLLSLDEAAKLIGGLVTTRFPDRFWVREHEHT